MESNKARIKTFLARYIHNYDLQDDQDIFALGFVNSLFAMQLVLFVEKDFGVEVSNDDLDIDNFRTVNAIAALIEKKAAPEVSPVN